MKASERAKQLGCKSLKQISDQVGKPVQTLINWHKDSSALFDAVCLGVVSGRICQTKNPCDNKQT